MGARASVVGPVSRASPAASGSNREGESTDAEHRDGVAPSSGAKGLRCSREHRPTDAIWQREEPVDEAKPFKIPKREVWEAFQRVKANQGAAGVDGQSIADFEADLRNNLYKLWNRMSSGSYFPPPGGALIFRRRMAERDRWAFQRFPIASPRKSRVAIWSRCSIRIPTATGPASLPSMPCAWLVNAVGVTTGC